MDATTGNLIHRLDHAYTALREARAHVCEASNAAMEDGRFKLEQRLAAKLPILDTLSTILEDIIDDLDESEE